MHSSEVKLELFTESGVFHLRGRPGSKDKHAIYGLFTFARILTQIYSNAQSGCTNASAQLNVVREALNTSLIKAEKIKVDIESFYLEAEGLAKSLSVDKSQPISTPIKFSNPLAFQGAILLKDIDAVISQVELCERFSLISKRQASKLKSEAIKCVRSLFHTVSSYRSSLDTLKSAG